MVIYLEFLPNHAVDVGPAVDCDRICKDVVGIAGLVLIPAAVVIEAVIFITGRKLIQHLVQLFVQDAVQTADPILCTRFYAVQCVGFDKLFRSAVFVNI